MAFYIGTSTAEPDLIRQGGSEQYGHVDMIFHGSQRVWPSFLTGIADIVGNYSAQMAVTSDGKLLCMGTNGPERAVGMSHPYISDEYYTTGGLRGRGNLGRFFVNPNISGVKQAALGTYHSLILLTGGVVYGCGYNYYGQLGNGNTTAQSDFVQVATGGKAVYADGYSSFIIKNDDSLWCAGQCYTDSTKTYPTVWTTNANMKNVAEVSPGDWANWSFRKKDGTVWGFSRTTGDLTAIPNGTGAVSVAYKHFVKSDGTLWEIYEDYPTYEFRQVNGVSNAASVAFTDYQTWFVVRKDGALLGKSAFNFGQLGLGDRNPRAAFTLIPGISDVRKVIGNTKYAEGYSMTLTNAATVWAAAGRSEEYDKSSTFGLDHALGWQRI